MATLAETLVLAAMVLIGLATAGFLAFVVRDLVARVAAGARLEDILAGPADPETAGDGPTEPDTDAESEAAKAVEEADRALRVAMLGPGLYLVGFLAVVASVVLAPGPVAGVAVADVGLAIIVLAGVPMAAGLYLAREAGRG